MKYSKELIAVLTLVTSFFLLKFNPISINMNVASIFGLITIIIFGSLITIAGIIKVPSFFFLPLLFFTIFDMRALGLFIFAFIGNSVVSSTEKNMIKPKIQKLARIAFSGYTIFVLISVLAIYNSIQFKIPTAISGMAINLLVPVIGCETTYTGQECVDSLVNEMIIGQCEDNALCISALNDKRAELELGFIQQLENQFPTFSTDKTVQTILISALENQVMTLIEGYEWVFNIIMAFAIFTVFQFLGTFLSILSGFFAFILLKIFESTGGIKKETKEVEKIIFST